MAAAEVQIRQTIKEAGGASVGGEDESDGACGMDGIYAASKVTTENSSMVSKPNMPSGQGGAAPGRPAVNLAMAAAAVVSLSALGRCLSHK